MASEEQGRPLLAAATVVVLRDAAVAPEVFMVRRHERTAFMAGAFVFPGGRVDPADGAVIATQPHHTAVAAYGAAALRELFEEAGILLARDRSGGFVTMAEPARRQRLERARRDVHDG